MTSKRLAELNRQTKILQALKDRKPDESLDAIAERIGVSRTFVSRVGDRSGIRPVKHREMCPDKEV